MTVAPQESLAKGAVKVTLLTAVSRLTGFLRVIAVAAAMGTTFLANTYQTANTAPNVIFELVAAGVLTSVFVPTFVAYIARDEHEEGWSAANALTSVALVALTGIALLVGLLAPWIMRLLLIGIAKEGVRENAITLGTSFLRLFAPQIVFYGAGMIMTAALHARRHFTMPALAPIFNNVVVIAVYLLYMAMRHGNGNVGGVSTGETWLLGFGTTVGVIAMTLCLVPSLRRLGWRFRFDPDVKHPAVRKGSRLGGWALGYAGGYQAGLIVVLILANKVEGGVAAYQWAYTFFYLPHALIGVPVFNVLFTAMSEHAAARDTQGIVQRLQEGISMLVFVLLPLSGLMIVAADPIARLTLDYGLMTSDGAALVARVLSAFAVGLAAFSCFLVMTRAFYALADTKTPALINGGTMVAAIVVGATLFYSLPAEWSVAGLALGHSAAYLFGALVLGKRLGGRLDVDLFSGIRAPLAAALAGSFAATLVMVAVHALLPDGSKLGALLDVIVTAAAGAGAYGLVMAKLGSEQLARIRVLAASLRGARR
ncbi:MAG: putative peptidoglycan lipid flippase [Actinomycetota bacterium]|nr:putative peptidoglycan lipid flippase [Actinomycetota bacterium]